MGRIRDKEFFMRTVKNLFFTGLALLAITLASCKQDGGGPPVTGLPTVTVTDAALEGQSGVDAASITIPNQDLPYGAGSFSVTGGKLSLSLTAPSGSIPTIGSANGLTQHDGFGRTDSGYELTLSDPDAQMYAIFELRATVGTTDYLIQKSKDETDGETYYRFSSGGYIYVDKDCTISREAKSWTWPYGGGGTAAYNFSAFDLPLKAGWNLIQMGGETTMTGNSISIEYAMKLGDSDVPWSIEIDS
jgi:hypothetical protein